MLLSLLPFWAQDLKLAKLSLRQDQWGGDAGGGKGGEGCWWTREAVYCETAVANVKQQQKVRKKLFFFFLFLERAKKRIQ